MSRHLLRRVSNRVIRQRRKRVDGWVSVYCRAFDEGSESGGDESERAE